MEKSSKKAEEAAKKAAAKRSHLARFRNEMKKRTVGYVLAAFGLVAGLAWNDAIKSTIEYFYPMTASTVYAKVLYALIMTFLIVVLSIYTMGWVEDKEKDKK